MDTPSQPNSVNTISGLIAQHRARQRTATVDAAWKNYEYQCSRLECDYERIVSEDVRRVLNATMVNVTEDVFRSMHEGYSRTGSIDDPFYVIEDPELGSDYQFWYSLSRVQGHLALAANVDYGPIQVNTGADLIEGIEFLRNEYQQMEAAREAEAKETLTICFLPCDPWKEAEAEEAGYATTEGQ